MSFHCTYVPLYEYMNISPTPTPRTFNPNLIPLAPQRALRPHHLPASDMLSPKTLPLVNSNPPKREPRKSAAAPGRSTLGQGSYFKQLRFRGAGC